MLIEPLTAADAEALARKILVGGEVRFLAHFEERAAQRNIPLADCFDAVEAGPVLDISFEKGTWRYRFETPTTAVALLFEDEGKLWFVTVYDPRDPKSGNRREE